MNIFFQTRRHIVSKKLLELKFWLEFTEFSAKPRRSTDRWSQEETSDLTRITTLRRFSTISDCCSWSAASLWTTPCKSSACRRDLTKATALWERSALSLAGDEHLIVSWAKAVTFVCTSIKIYRIVNNFSFFIFLSTKQSAFEWITLRGASNYRWSALHRCLQHRLPVL